jgi:hypothetical protein
MEREIPMADDRNSPATRGDLADLRIELKNEIANQLASQKDELIEAIRDSQTEVLKAFYGFSQTIQERFKQADDAETAIKRRMATLESRVLEVEKRLNMPPNAA